MTGERTSQLPVGAVPAVPLSTQGRSDAYEVGSAVLVGSPGRYKSFATAFAARPIVVGGPVRVGGTRHFNIGLPAPGSFHLHSTPGGSVTAQYIAFGQR